MSLIIRPGLFGAKTAFGVGSRRHQKGYREAQRYREAPKYREFGVGASMPTHLPSGVCFNPMSGTIVGGPLDGVKPPPGTYSVGASSAQISLGGDVMTTLPLCGSFTSRPGGSGGGCGSARVPTPSDPCRGPRDVICEPEDSPCEIKPARCDCQVLAGNTLNDASQPGIASGEFGTVLIDSGDADFFQPRYMHVNAFQVGAPTIEEITGDPLPVLLQDSRSGRKPNLRRASTDDPSYGICTTVYGQQKDLECVDWHRFKSTNNQVLTLTFYNPNTVAVHVFVDLWGTVVMQ